LAGALDVTVNLHAAIVGVNALTVGKRVAKAGGEGLRPFAVQPVNGLVNGLCGDQAAALCNCFRPSEGATDRFE
jgi:hypothetical protein